MHYSEASVLPPTAVQSAHSISQYHFSLLPELISHRCPTPCGPHALTQPFRQLSKVEDRFYLHHYTCSTLNPTIAYAANGKADSSGIAALHSVPPPIRLHTMLLLWLYPVETCKVFVSRYQRMPQCHIPVLPY